MIRIAATETCLISLRLRWGICGAWRPRFQELFFAVQERIYVVGSELDAVAMSDGVGGAGLDAVAAKNAARIIDVVNLGVAFACGDAIRVGILSRLDVNAIRGTCGGTQEASDAFFIAVFIALQDVNAAIAGLDAGGDFRKILGRRGTEHGSQGDAETLEQSYECFADFLD